MVGYYVTTSFLFVPDKLTANKIELADFSEGLTGKNWPLDRVVWHSTLLRFQLREMLIEAKASSLSTSCSAALNLLDLSVDATGELNINVTKAKAAIESEWRIFSKLLGHITVLAEACLHECKMAQVCQRKGWSRVLSYEGKAEFDRAATERLKYLEKTDKDEPKEKKKKTSDSAAQSSSSSSSSGSKKSGKGRSSRQEGSASSSAPSSSSFGTDSGSNGSRGSSRYVPPPDRHCAICKNWGHWHRECPMAPKKA